MKHTIPLAVERAPVTATGDKPGTNRRTQRRAAAGRRARINKHQRGHLWYGHSKGTVQGRRRCAAARRGPTQASASRVPLRDHVHRSHHSHSLVCTLLVGPAGAVTHRGAPRRRGPSSRRARLMLYPRTAPGGSHPTPRGWPRGWQTALTPTTRTTSAAGGGGHAATRAPGGGCATGCA